MTSVAGAISTIRAGLPVLLCLALGGLHGCADGGTRVYDFDGDGVQDQDDCGSADPSIYPGADDLFGDSIDSNCDGSDGVDSDGDGYASTDSGGDDCNDGDASIHPGADDPDDAVDQDCDGFGRQTTVDLRPDTPITSDELYLQVVSDSAVLGIGWFVDGSERSEYSGFEEIPSSQTSRGEAWRVEVIPYNAVGLAGVAVSDSVIIANSAPSAATLNQGLEPAPREGDVLTALGSASDNDLDAVTILYSWFVNDVQVSPTPEEQLDSTHFDKGDSIYVVLTPSDGSDEGTPITSNVVTAVNTAPLAVGAALSPTEGTEETTFSCAVSGWLDPDPADVEGYDFQWYVNDGTSVTTATLDGTSFERGDLLRCEATPNDGEDPGATLASAALTVANTLPTVASVAVDPASGGEGTTFTCLATGWLDPDPADATPTYMFQWYVGAPGSEAATVTTETIDGSSFARGDSIYCEATPVNGADAGTPVVSAAVVVGNAAPEITSASIEPVGATTTDALSVLPVGWTDADGDAAAYLYQWWIEDPSGSVVDGGTAETLAPGETLRFDSITVEVTPTDGTDSGSVVLAGPVVIANTPPGPPLVSATPGSPQSSDDLVCSIATESADPDVTDGTDSLSYDFEWLDDSGPSTYVLLAGTAGSSLTVPESSTSEGETWTCEVTPSDSEGAGTTGSSLLVINSTPGAPTISVSVGTPPDDADLVCVIATPASDPDGDPLSYDFEWLDPSGAVAYSLPGGTESDTLSVPASATTTGETWTCSVSASDGLVAGPAAQEIIVVPNTEVCSGLSFDGLDDYAHTDATLSSILTLGTAWTTEAWFRIDSEPGATAAIFSTSCRYFGAYVGSNGRIRGYRWGISSSWMEGATYVADGRWHHVALVTTDGGGADGNETALYLDGQEEVRDSVVDDMPSNMLVEWVLLGASSGTCNSSSGLLNNFEEHFAGDITAFRMSSGERYTNAFSPEPFLQDDPTTLLLWNMEDIGSTLTDQSSNGHNGTISGATVTATCPGEDLDGDGTPTYQDCDDDDPDSAVRTNDANCDGVEDVITAGGFDLIAIPAGTFEMGCTAGQSGCQSDESPAHTVTLSRGFWMGETEVTQGQWLTHEGNSPASFGSCGADCPVESVSWYDALSFANSVSVSESLERCYDLSACTGTVGSTFTCSAVAVNSPSGSVYACEGYRLPTEAEWEYAARAGNDLLYAGSNDADDVAWHSGNTSSAPEAVGLKLPNAYGLYDMSGNVFEWTWDHYGSYPNSTSSDPEGPTTGSDRVSRGGAWNNPDVTSRLANRDDDAPGTHEYETGFRIARTAPVDDDGDGVLSDRDCDDGDPTLGDVADDPNCDGVDDLTTSGGIEFIGLAGGTFEMGCTVAQQADGNCNSDESPDHEVTLSRPFWMGETEVTQAQWEGLMGNNPSYFGPNGVGPDCGGDCPVEMVNWYETLTLANALSSAEGMDECYTLSSCTGTVGGGCGSHYCPSGTYTCSTVSVNSPTGSPYDCEGYRLPTEAEWEYAARAGTDLLYAGSNTVDDVAWHYFNSGSVTHSVATKLPNAWGLYDMSGNVWEWAWDWYGGYSSSAVTDPEGPSTGVSRLFHGGSFMGDWSILEARVSSRHDYSPAIRAWTPGFRLARTIPIDGDGSSAATAGTDCATILNSGFSTGDGNYWIDGDGSSAFEAYCDMSTDGGGWLLVSTQQPNGLLSSSAASTNVVYNLGINQKYSNVVLQQLADLGDYHVMVEENSGADRDAGLVMVYRLPQGTSLRFDGQDVPVETVDWYIGGGQYHTVDNNAGSTGSWSPANNQYYGISVHTGSQGDAWNGLPLDQCCVEKGDFSVTAGSNCDYKLDFDPAQDGTVGSSHSGTTRCIHGITGIGISHWVRSAAPDLDGDGYYNEEDCDDSDASIYPLAGDTFGDGVDSDCDGLDCEADRSSTGTYFAACDTGGASYFQAKDLCQDGGYDTVASLHSQAESDTVQALAQAIGATEAWIGLTGAGDSTTYAWTDDTASSYSNWFTGQPAQASEQCTKIDISSGQWHDNHCNNAMSFVCVHRESDCADGEDNDRDGDVDGADFDCSVIDADGDGYGRAEDCDDTRDFLHPYDSDGDGTDDDCGWRHVAAGDYHTCGIDSAGSARCWGSDSSGASTPPVGAGYEPWLAFGLGEYSSCGITSTNGLECWGNSSRLGTTPSSGAFSVLEVGSWHACAIDANNEIECWGGIGIPAGQMASPTTGSFTDISVGSRHSCAIDSSGAAQCWGCGISYGQCASQSSSFTDITAGAWISCGITTTNAVECWGSNGNGELTDLPNSGTFTSVSSGGYHTCAIATDGSLECWGCSAGNSGQCSQTPSGSFREISAGGRHVCAIDTAGAMHCWGSNSDGQSTPP